jgi:hypothetical protein
VNVFSSEIVNQIKKLNETVLYWHQKRKKRKVACFISTPTKIMKSSNKRAMKYLMIIIKIKIYTKILFEYLKRYQKQKEKRIFSRNVFLFLSHSFREIQIKHENRRLRFSQN